MILRPNYLEKIMAFADTPSVKILTGMRRSGKTTILRMVEAKLRERGIGQDRILTYSFDSRKTGELRTAKRLYDEVIGKLPAGGRTYLFFDEIQEVKDWEKAVNSLMAGFDVDIYVAGSNSRMLTPAISSYLAGRFVQFRVFPLSFSEYLAFRKEYGAGGGIHAEFARYLRLGGFPAIHMREFEPEEAYAHVRDIYNATVYNDIVKPGQIRGLEQFERVALFAFDNSGRTFPSASISRDTKGEQRNIGTDAVYACLKRLEGAYMLHRCLRYDLERKEILKSREKYYVADPALQYCLLGYSPNSIAAMQENAVYMELLRRGYRVHVGQLPDGDIDFVAARGTDKLYVHVAKASANQRREYDRLLNIRDNYPKYVLGTDEVTTGNHEGIKSMHIADFLLSAEY